MQKVPIQFLQSLSTDNINVSVLRLDLLHPIVSGNKWFKLKYYLQDALDTGKTTIATFGGAYSNHVVATAFAAKNSGLNSIGYIRGEAPARLSPTLLQAIEFGMQLQFVSRAAFKHKTDIIANDPSVYLINEGGYGFPGAAGAADIMELVPGHFSDVLCAVGTGTMMAGLIKASTSQRITGISILKNEPDCENAVRALLSPVEQQKKFNIIHDYHFGGYAKHPPQLIAYMKELWEREKLPTDIVYTSKLAFAAQDLVGKQHFSVGSNLLLIHSGGLQGNRSLPEGTLPF